MLFRSYRVHIAQHPLHANTKLHQNCDLLYADLEYSQQYDNVVVNAGLNYFRYIFDTDYYNGIYEIMLGHINHLTDPNRCLHLTFFNNPGIRYPFRHFQNLSQIFAKHPGTVNHLSDQGHKEVIQAITPWIDQHC